jgi:D-arginine dehydrogenase
VAAPLVILAGGPWANALAVEAGLPPLPLRPCRRHLAVLERRGWGLDPGWPFVWHRTAGFYLRPESGGLLVCACDVEDHPPADVGPSEAGIAALTERSLEMLRDAEGALLRTAWAGLRTLTPDHHFVIGPDPALPGLLWVAGLGGHGMTTSAAVGELVAAGRDDAVTRALAPARFR